MQCFHHFFDDSFCRSSDVLKISIGNIYRLFAEGPNRSVELVFDPDIVVINCLQEAEPILNAYLSALPMSGNS